MLMSDILCRPNLHEDDPSCRLEHPKNVAILTVERAFVFHEGVRPICIANNFPLGIRPYRVAKVAGFGQTSEIIKLTVSFFQADHKRCEKNYLKKKHVILMLLI